MQKTTRAVVFLLMLSEDARTSRLTANATTAAKDVEMVAYKYVMNFGYCYGTIVHETTHFVSIACQWSGKVTRLSRKKFDLLNRDTAAQRRAINDMFDSMYS